MIQEPVHRLETLREHIVRLASLPETSAPVISAYFDTTRPVEALRGEFQSWAASVRPTFDAASLRLFEEARQRLEDRLRQPLPPSVRSLAAFSRGGDEPLLELIPLGARIETSFHTSTLPALFPLVQAMDRFHRFVVAFTTETHARILEISLGTISRELLAERPDLHPRLGREWTREHYHHRKREHDRRFLREQAQLIEELMIHQGCHHLILSGHPRQLHRLREILPKAIRARIVRQLPPTNPLDRVIHAFIDAEREESTHAVERLHQEIRRDGLGVVGIHSVRQALHQGNADLLILSENLSEPDREALLRLATLRQVPIEVCEEDPLLDEYGGVGCLLRYKPFDRHEWTLASA